MSYAYQYAEGLKQFGMVHLILKLTDSDNILPEVNIPVVLDDSEYTEENLIKIANEIIASNTKRIVQEIIPLVEDIAPVIEETIINNLSTE